MTIIFNFKILIMKKRISKIIAGLSFIVFLAGFVNSVDAACTPFGDTWIICDSQVLDFFIQANENCDGEILGDILILAGC